MMRKFLFSRSVLFEGEKDGDSITAGDARPNAAIKKLSTEGLNALNSMLRGRNVQVDSNASFVSGGDTDISPTSQQNNKAGTSVSGSAGGVSPPPPPPLPPFMGGVQSTSQSTGNNIPTPPPIPSFMGGAIQQNAQQSSIPTPPPPPPFFNQSGASPSTSSQTPIQPQTVNTAQNNIKNNDLSQAQVDQQAELIAAIRARGGQERSAENIESQINQNRGTSAQVNAHSALMNDIMQRGEQNRSLDDIESQINENRRSNQFPNVRQNNNAAIFQTPQADAMIDAAAQRNNERMNNVVESEDDDEFEREYNEAANRNNASFIAPVQNNINNANINAQENRDNQDLQNNNTVVNKNVDSVKNQVNNAVSGNVAAGTNNSSAAKLNMDFLGEQLGKLRKDARLADNSDDWNDSEDDNVDSQESSVDGDIAQGADERVVQSNLDSNVVAEANDNLFGQEQNNLENSQNIENVDQNVVGDIYPNEEVGIRDDSQDVEPAVENNASELQQNNSENIEDNRIINPTQPQQTVATTNQQYQPNQQQDQQQEQRAQSQNNESEGRFASLARRGGVYDVLRENNIDLNNPSISSLNKIRLQYHPDKNPSPEAAEFIKNLNVFVDNVRASLERDRQSQEQPQNQQQPQNNQKQSQQGEINNIDQFQRGDMSIENSQTNVNGPLPVMDVERDVVGSQKQQQAENNLGEFQSRRQMGENVGEKVRFFEGLSNANRGSTQNNTQTRVPDGVVLDENGRARFVDQNKNFVQQRVSELNNGGANRNDDNVNQRPVEGVMGDDLNIGGAGVDSQGQNIASIDQSQDQMSMRNPLYQSDQVEQPQVAEQMSMRNPLYRRDYDSNIAGNDIDANNSGSLNNNINNNANNSDGGQNNGNQNQSVIQGANVTQQAQQQYTQVNNNTTNTQPQQTVATTNQQYQPNQQQDQQQEQRAQSQNNESEGRFASLARRGGVYDVLRENNIDLNNPSISSLNKIRLQYHPDKNPSPEAAEFIKNLNVFVDNVRASLERDREEGRSGGGSMGQDIARSNRSNTTTQEMLAIGDFDNDRGSQSLHAKPGSMTSDVKDNQKDMQNLFSEKKKVRFEIDERGTSAPVSPEVENTPSYRSNDSNQDRNDKKYVIKTGNSLQKDLIKAGAFSINRSDEQNPKWHKAHYGETPIAHGQMGHTPKGLVMPKKDDRDKFIVEKNGNKIDIAVREDIDMAVKFNKIHGKVEKNGSSVTNVQFDKYPEQSVTQEIRGKDVEVNMRGEDMKFNFDAAGRTFTRPGGFKDKPYVTVDSEGNPKIHVHDKKDLETLLDVYKNFKINGIAMGDIAMKKDGVQFNEEIKQQAFKVPASSVGVNRENIADKIKEDTGIGPPRNEKIAKDVSEVVPSLSSATKPIDVVDIGASKPSATISVDNTRDGARIGG